MIARTNFSPGVKRDDKCLTSPSQTRSRRTKKQREADEIAIIANDVLRDFPLIIENNLGDSNDISNPLGLIPCHRDSQLFLALIPCDKVSQQ